MGSPEEPLRVGPCVPRALALEWTQAWPSWFGPGRRGLRGFEDKADLALVESPLGPVVAKRERMRGWKRSLAALGARRSRSTRAFALAQELHARTLPTPEPLCVLGRAGSSVFVTRFVAGIGPWELAAETGVEALVALLAEALHALHAAGYRHRDLKAANLLFARAGSGHELQWTDLDSLTVVGTVRFGQRARDLERLATSFESGAARTAGVRAQHWPALVTRYLTLLHGRPPNPVELERVLDRTRAWSERAMRRHLRRGQRVH